MGCSAIIIVEIIMGGHSMKRMFQLFSMLIGNDLNFSSNFKCWEFCECGMGLCWVSITGHSDIVKHLIRRGYKKKDASYFDPVQRSTGLKILNMLQIIIKSKNVFVIEG